MPKSTGWVSVHRKIRETAIWDNEDPFDKRSAWIDLLLEANHEDRQFLLGNEVINAKRGEIITSEIKLMNRWKWSKTKVRNFLETLKNLEMIEKKTDTKKTTLKIVKYEVYQDMRTTREPLEDHLKTTKEPREDTNNNYNNLNNLNNDNNIIINTIKYLNEKVGSAYKNNSKKTISLIEARLKEKYSLEDFKTVIDKKVVEWKGTDLEKYLRPETLFGNKFEGYLNQVIIPQKEDKPKKEEKASGEVEGFYKRQLF